METRKDLETRITEKLCTVSANDMQRIAEDYAQIRHPIRFTHFDFRALSSSGRTRDGWPDAFLLRPDGLIDGVEATTRQKIWSLASSGARHLTGNAADSPS